jgi:hypothetical protein
MGLDGFGRIWIGLDRFRKVLIDFEGLGNFLIGVVWL